MSPRKKRSNINKPMSHGGVGRIASKSLFDEDGPYDIDEFHDIFIELADPTEYKATLELVGTWQEWERIKRDWPSFNNYIIMWKEELDTKFKSEAITRINALAKTDHYQANKWIAEEGYTEKGKAGRPNKKEKKRAADEIARAAAETKEEKSRVLKLVNSGPSS